MDKHFKNLSKLEHLDVELFLYAVPTSHLRSIFHHGPLCDILDRPALHRHLPRSFP